ncbi:MAG: hypothetical protein ABII06_10600 [Pseudomonadota bacterium]
MKKIWIAVFLLVFALGSPAWAKPKVTCTVKKVSQHEKLVTFIWEVTVVSDKKWEACDLRISFLDAKGQELYALSEQMKVLKGEHFFSGHDICDKNLWNRISKYLTTFDCVF